MSMYYKNAAATLNQGKIVLWLKVNKNHHDFDYQKPGFLYILYTTERF